MKLTDKERKALRDSIDYWQEDIINKFVGRNRISTMGLSLWWTKSKEFVKCYDKSCALCIGIQNAQDDCRSCIYTRFYRYDCGSLRGDWLTFVNKPTKETAIAMRDALQVILDSDNIRCGGCIHFNDCKSKHSEDIHTFGKDGRYACWHEKESYCNIPKVFMCNARNGNEIKCEGFEKSDNSEFTCIYRHENMEECDEYYCNNEELIKETIKNK